MPAFETMDRYQRAVLWSKTGDGDDGEALVDRNHPEELVVRWTFAQSQGSDPQGNTISLDATLIVDREVVIDSIAYEGGLEDLAGTGFGDDEVDLYQVKTSKRVTDIKHRFTRRELGLVRYRGTLPEHGEG